MVVANQIGIRDVDKALKWSHKVKVIKEDTDFEAAASFDIKGFIKD